MPAIVISIPTAKQIKKVVKHIFKEYGETSYNSARPYVERYGVKGNLVIFKKLISNMNDAHIRNCGENGGIRMQKRLKRFYNNYVVKQSLYSANRLLWLINKHVLNERTSISIHDVKHDKIQALRKEWKKLQVESDKALKAYKDEKGDYYKRINK